MSFETRSFWETTLSFGLACTVIWVTVVSVLPVYSFCVLHKFSNSTAKRIWVCNKNLIWLNRLANTEVSPGSFVSLSLVKLHSFFCGQRWFLNEQLSFVILIISIAPLASLQFGHVLYWCFCSAALVIWNDLNSSEPLWDWARASIFFAETLWGIYTQKICSCRNKVFTIRNKKKVEFLKKKIYVSVAVKALKTFWGQEESFFYYSYVRKKYL